MNKHDGTLSGNTTVWIDDDPHSDSRTGNTFYITSVFLSDNMRHFALLPCEALLFLKWLEEHRETLEHLVETEQAQVMGDD